MKLLVKLDDGAFMPTWAHETDAGLDIRTPKGFVIGPRSSAIVHSGVHVQLPPDTAGLIWSKSGLNITHAIISTGVIDEGYTGEIVVKLYNLGDKEYEFKTGDKITQMIVQPVVHSPIEVVSKLDETERGANGFGSTGR